MLKSIITLLLCSAAFCVRAEPEIKGSPNELAQFLSGVPKTAIITGEAWLKVPAEQAVITLKITTYNKSLQNALRLNHELRGKLMNYLNKQGISTNQVQASKFSSTPKFGWLSEKAKSYQVENVVKVTVKGEKEFQAVGGAVDEWSEVQYMGIELEHADKEAAKKQAMANACDNATEHRKIYEEKFGVRLVPKAIFEDPTLQNILHEQRDLGVLSGGTQPSLESLTSGLTQMPAKAAVDTIESTSPFGELTFTTRVTVEYSVEAK